MLRAEMVGHEEVKTPLITELYPQKRYKITNKVVSLNYFHRIPEDVHDCIKEIFGLKLF